MDYKDSLGDRMKERYENRTRVCLPRRTWTIIRIDGKAFHTYTRNFDKPFDMGLTSAFDAVARRLIGQIQVVARSLFSYKELLGLSTIQLRKKILFEKGVNWGSFSRCKNGGLVA